MRNTGGKHVTRGAFSIPLLVLSLPIRSSNKFRKCVLHFFKMTAAQFVSLVSKLEKKKKYTEIPTDKTT